MNYRNEVENYINCFAQNKLIVAGKLFQEKLNFIPEATYYKILERLMKENRLIRVSKGIYTRPKTTRFGETGLNESSIITHYAKMNKKSGMMIGYGLYNKLGLTTQISKKTELYSNLITEEKKVFNNIQIKRINMSLNKSKTDIIEAFETLQHYYEIEDINFSAFREYIKKVANLYNDSTANEVLGKIKYKKRTIAFLQMILNYFGVQNTLSSYLTNTSTYKIPKMEEINEAE
ncbi:MAG: DUF6088 family protein [Clostridia bacterium]|jgi:hypothetical protein